MARRSKQASAKTPQKTPKVRRRKRRRAPAVSAARNPAPDWVATAEVFGYGLGGFAVSRLASRIVSVQVAKKKPTWAKHAGVATGVLAFAAAYFLAKRWKHTAKYQHELQLGTFVALAQTAIQTYLPKLGWILADATPEQVEAAQGAQALPVPAATGILDEMDNDDDDWAGYRDTYDQGRFHGREAMHPHASAPRGVPVPASSPQPPPAPSTGPADPVDDLLAELDDDQGGGVFAPN